MSYKDPKAFFEKELRLLEELRVSLEELRASQRKTDEQLRETEKTVQQTNKQLSETEKVVQQTNKQLGELGNKFGSFAEGLSLPSMVKVLAEQFGAPQAYPGAKSRLNGESLEIDLLGHGAAPDSPAYIVEVKSRLTTEGIKQILKTIAAFPKFFPQHAQRPVYGILVAVDSTPNARRDAEKAGLYLAHASNDVFTLQVPSDFKPRVFGPGKHNGHVANGHAKRKNRKPEKH